MRHVQFPWLLIFLLATLLLTAGGRTAPQDEETAYRMAANLIESGRFTITTQDFTLEVQPFPGFLPHLQPRTYITTWAGPGRDGRLPALDAGERARRRSARRRDRVRRTPARDAERPRRLSGHPHPTG